MKLYYNIASTYSQKVLVAFYEKGVEFTPQRVNFDPASIAEYRKLTPFGKVPLLTGDDLFIPESTIIVEYLENEYPNQGTQLIPDDKTAARRVRFKDRIADLYVNAPVSTIYLDSRKPIDKQNSQAVAAAHSTLDMVFGLYEQFLSNNLYASGNEFTLADCSVFGPLFYAQHLHPFADKPNLSAYFKRLTERQSCQKVLAELLPALETVK